MREIKFRGKRVDNDEWVYGMLDCIYKEDGVTTISYVDNEGFYCEDKVDYETVGQFTGLLDKDGKEIYEGDIVNHGYENINGKFYEIGSVVFSVNDGAFEISFNSPYLKRLTRKMIIQYNVEVVGNIHDNKELLND